MHRITASDPVLGALDHMLRQVVRTPLMESTVRAVAVKPRRLRVSRPRPVRPEDIQAEANAFWALADAFSCTVAFEASMQLPTEPALAGQVAERWSRLADRAYARGEIRFQGLENEAERLERLAREGGALESAEARRIPALRRRVDETRKAVDRVVKAARARGLGSNKARELGRMVERDLRSAYAQMRKGRTQRQWAQAQLGPVRELLARIEDEKPARKLGQGVSAQVEAIWLIRLDAGIETALAEFDPVEVEPVQVVEVVPVVESVPMTQQAVRLLESAADQLDLVLELGPVPPAVSVVIEASIPAQGIEWLHQRWAFRAAMKVRARERKLGAEVLGLLRKGEEPRQGTEQLQVLLGWRRALERTSERRLKLGVTDSVLALLEARG